MFVSEVVGASNCYKSDQRGARQFSIPMVLPSSVGRF
jgi:hypothetical protein